MWFHSISHWLVYLFILFIYFNGRELVFFYLLISFKKLTEAVDGEVMMKHKKIKIKIQHFVAELEDVGISPHHRRGEYVGEEFIFFLILIGFFVVGGFGNNKFEKFCLAWKYIYQLVCMMLKQNVRM
jgi:hypothetical protein